VIYRGIFGIECRYVPLERSHVAISDDTVKLWHFNFVIFLTSVQITKVTLVYSLVIHFLIDIMSQGRFFLFLSLDRIQINLTRFSSHPWEKTFLPCLSFTRNCRIQGVLGLYIEYCHLPSSLSFNNLIFHPLTLSVTFKPEHLVIPKSHDTRKP
jgi:hypothetical protein